MGQEATPTPTPEPVPELTPESPPTSSPTPSKVCVDTANYIWCKKEAGKGKCEQMWFANACRSTCGLCDPRGTPIPSPTPGPTSEPTPTVNELTQEATPTPTPEPVPELTSESTPSPSPAPSTVCVDTANDIWCKKEAEKGKCVEMWFANKCRSTCGLCDPMGTPTPSPAPSK